MARVKQQRTPSSVVMTMIDGRPATGSSPDAARASCLPIMEILSPPVPEDMAQRIAASWTRQSLDTTNFEGTIRQS